MPKFKADHQIELIKDIVESFVEEIAKDHLPLATKLIALDNLKWVFKGRESEIVQAIDIRRIWESNVKAGCDQAMLNSILELIEVLISFCARKIQEQGSAESADSAPSLKRHVSTIDETSMTNILVKSLSLLITEMSSSIEKLVQAPAINMQDYLRFSHTKLHSATPQIRCQVGFHSFEGNGLSTQTSADYVSIFEKKQFESHLAKVDTISGSASKSEDDFKTEKSITVQESLLESFN